MKKKLFIPLVIIVAFIVLLVFITVKGKNSEIVMWINEEPVYAQEFMMFAESYRSQVFSCYKKNYGAEFDENFWNRTFGGETPADYLLELVIAKITSLKNEQILAKRLDLVSAIDFTDFLSHYQETNRQRDKALNEKKVIYGPKNYKILDYYLYKQTNLKAACIQFYENHIHVFDESTWDAFLESIDYKKKYDYTLDIITLNILKADSIGLDEKENALNRLKQIKDDYLEINKIKNALFDLPHKADCYQLSVLANEVYPEDSLENELTDILIHLEDKDISDPIYYNGKLIIFKVLNKKEAISDLSNYQNAYVEWCYEKYQDANRKNLIIEIDDTKIQNLLKKLNH